MREILFRGKRLDNGEWVEGSLVVSAGRCYILPGIADFSYGDNGSRVRIGCFIEVAPATVGQYTGLKDKNGQRIFEGDMVAQSWYDHGEPIDDVLGEVVYCTNDCSFSVMTIEKTIMESLGHCNAFAWEIEVCGNIHDNPKLLEGGAKGE